MTKRHNHRGWAIAAVLRDHHRSYAFMGKLSAHVHGDEWLVSHHRSTNVAQMLATCSRQRPHQDFIKSTMNALSGQALLKPPSPQAAKTVSITLHLERPTSTSWAPPSNSKTPCHGSFILSTSTHLSVATPHARPRLLRGRCPSTLLGVCLGYRPMSVQLDMLSPCA